MILQWWHHKDDIYVLIWRNIKYKKDIAKYYNISRPAISKILSGELFDKHIAEFETTINGGSYKVIDDNKLNMWKDRNSEGIDSIIDNIVKAINTYKTL